MQFPKRIAVVVGEPQSLKNFRLNMMLDFQKKGAEVWALAPFRGDGCEEDMKSFGIKISPFSMDRKSVNIVTELKTIFSLNRIFRKIKPDAIIAFTPKVAMYSAIAGKLARVKNINQGFTGIGFPSVSKSVISKCCKICYEILLDISMRCATHVIFQNPDNLIETVNNHRSAKNKSFLIRGSGVDLSHYTPSDAPSDPIVFTYLGRLIKSKGIVEFIDAARLISKKYRNVKFLLVGGVDNNPTSISEAEYSELKNNPLFECTGQVKDVRPYIAKSSVLVLPSYSEGCPRSMLEAMSTKRPIIVADTSGTREPLFLSEETKKKHAYENVREGLNGFLVKSHSAEAVAEAMEKFIKSPSLINEMGSNGLKLVEKYYSVEKIDNSINSIIENGIALPY